MGKARLLLFGLLLFTASCVAQPGGPPDWSDPNSVEPAFGTFGPDDPTLFPQFIDMCMDDMLKAPEDQMVVCAMSCQKPQYAGVAWCARTN